MLNFVIIDDEIKAVKTLEWELNKCCKDFKILERFTDPKQAVEFLKSSHNVDAILLDVNMPDIDGFEVLRQLPNRDFEVIFLTAYEEYAINAIRANALDYILKPIDTEDLAAAIVKLEKKRLENSLEEKLEKVIDKAAIHTGRNTLHNKISISCNGKLIFINPSEILYCESDGNYCTIYLESGKSLFLTQKLKVVEDDFKPMGNFFRIHNSYLVNLEQVVAYSKDDSCVILTNNKHIPVSRQRKAEFLNQF